MVRYQSVVKTSSTCVDRNDVAALAVVEDDPMTATATGHQLRWTVAFSARNVTFGIYRLGLTRALVEMTLSGMKCISTVRDSVETEKDFGSETSNTDDANAGLSGSAGAGGMKVSAKLSSSRLTKQSTTVTAKQKIEAEYVKQRTLSEHPQWEFTTPEGAAQLATTALLNYAREIPVELHVDDDSSTLGKLQLQPKAEDLILVDTQNNTRAPGPRRKLFFGLLRQHNLMKAYAPGGVALDVIGVDFVLQKTTSQKPKAIPLKGRR